MRSTMVRVTTCVKTITATRRRDDADDADDADEAYDKDDGEDDARRLPPPPSSTSAAAACPSPRRPSTPSCGRCRPRRRCSHPRRLCRCPWGPRPRWRRRASRRASRGGRCGSGCGRAPTRMAPRAQSRRARRAPSRRARRAPRRRATRRRARQALAGSGGLQGLQDCRFQGGPGPASSAAHPNGASMGPYRGRQQGGPHGAQQ